MSADTPASGQIPHWSLPVSRWAIWNDAHAAGEKPDLSFVDPMLRRRLSPLARAAFHVAHQCCARSSGTPIIYASRHGELERTLELFNALATNEALSPTTFGLSVLNASAGLYAIAHQDTAAATAVAAGSETFGYGLLEAWSRLQSTGNAVLYVYADSPVPPPLACQATDPTSILAIGILLEPTADRVIQCSTEPHKFPEKRTGQSQAIAFASLFEGARSVEWQSERRRWRWSQ
ncbi:MAG TPA: beta-ketoacyl synthase chain length factor [Rhodocyclaceae bacterium]|nr:beta-ketoacyl synthase chain length factor [Rhodocyclaceae bacterium]